MIVARATLTPIRTLLCGDVTLPARGTYAITLTKGEDRRELRVGWNVANLTRKEDVWRGHIVIDRYQWDVTAYPGTPAWEVEFDG